jgi:hypothetical protein
MVPCSSEVLKTSKWQGLPRRTAKTLCPSILGQGARSPVVEGRAKPTNFHVRDWPAIVSGGQAPIASCAHPECSRGGGQMHQLGLNLAAWVFAGLASLGLLGMA